MKTTDAEKILELNLTIVDWIFRYGQMKEYARQLEVLFLGMTGLCFILIVISFLK